MRNSQNRLSHTALGLYMIVAGGYLAMAWHFPFAYIWATYEDLVGEWIQVYCFLFAMVYAGGLSLRSEPARWFYRLLTVGCFYVIMEEIS